MEQRRIISTRMQTDADPHGAAGVDNCRLVLDLFTVFTESIGVDASSRLSYGRRFPADLDGTELLSAYLNRTSLKSCIFVLGAKPHPVQRAFDEAHRGFTARERPGSCDGFFLLDDEATLCERISTARADVLPVAMGNPLQEFWIDRCAASTGATVCVGVGALFDFLSGEVARAPDWLRRFRFEWAYRLLQESGRLWRRYLIGNIVFLWHAWQERG